MKAYILLCLAAVALASKESETKTCLEEPDEGLCRGYFPFFYYDPKTQTCKEFIYGGCGGNGNLYATEEECMDNCRDVVAWESSEDICDLPSETGECRAYFRRFYFDKTTGSCQRFVYGGCGGNENNFGTLEECEQRCKKASAPEPCEQEKEVGLCKAAFRRFYFNKQTGECELFIYGGCMGNENNFLTKEDCEAVCVE